MRRKLRRIPDPRLKQADMTTVGIEGTHWTLNGRATYPDTLAEGLLMNVRMVNSTFEDRNRSDFDPDANTDHFLSAVVDYYDHGIRAFTLNLQGGMSGYEGALNSAYESDGILRPEYFSRVERVIRACDTQGVGVILGCFYQRQDQMLADADAVRSAVANTASWVGDLGVANVLIEIANEHAHRGFTHEIIRRPEGQVELIGIAKETHPELIVTTSGMGSGLAADAVAEAGDFIIIHFNNTDMSGVPDRIDAMRRFEKPVLCNEDTKVGKRGADAASLCVENGCSWGLMRSDVNQYEPFVFEGAADDPVVYARLKELTH